MQHLKWRILEILDEGIETTSAVEPMNTQVENNSAITDRSARQQLRAVADDDQRTIRAARLSIIGSIRSSSACDSDPELVKDQQGGAFLSKQQRHLLRAHSREGSALSDISSGVELENPAPSTSRASPALNERHRRYHSMGDRERILVVRPPNSVSDIVLTLGRNIFLYLLTMLTSELQMTVEYGVSLNWQSFRL